MPGYLLDTNVVSETRRLRPNAGVIDFISKADQNALFLSVLLEAIVEWAEKRSLFGVALVGSHARGQAGPDSDIDLTILVGDPEPFRADLAWLAEIDWDRAHVRPMAHRDMSYGVVWSRHVELEGGPEVEFSFAAASWAQTEPVDPGTRQVVRNGYRVLYDPHGILAALHAAIENGN